jgi:excinuclease ABC subunit C
MNQDESQRLRLAALRELVELFPRQPGVYLMKGEDGEVLYVGKAKDLRARVKTYLLGGDGRAQLEFLMPRVLQIEKIVTANEQQAFVLERDLITRFKPRYNIRLKDDKAFLSIRIDESSAWPRLELVRRVESDGARYFGPFSFSHELRSLLDIIKRVVPLRSCSNTVFYNRQRPCLEYQIKRCCGPCCLPVEELQYRGYIKQAIAILEGRTEPLIKELQQAMLLASEALRFEEAAAIRDRLQVLENFKKGQGITASRGENRDIWGIFREEGLVSLTVLLMRAGRVVDSVNFALSEVELPDEAVLEAAVGQFYQKDHEIPEEILLPLELENRSMIEGSLAQRMGSAVEIVLPQRGTKARLLELAQVNAREHFITSFNADQRYKEVAQSLALSLGLSQIPRRIECLDISNFQSSDIVGAIVAFADGEALKSAYRKYKIRLQTEVDDFAAVAEVVERRLRRGMQENDLPDLLIIDGGSGQLVKALEARDLLGAKLEIVALAKMRLESGAKSRASRLEEGSRPERVFVEGRAEPIALEPGAALTHFLQRVRDEAHRYVIGFHRARRSKRVFGSGLEGVPGLKAAARRALLEQFLNVQGILAASPEQLAAAASISTTLAQRVQRLLAGRSGAGGGGSRKQNAPEKSS